MIFGAVATLAATAFGRRRSRHALRTPSGPPATPPAVAPSQGRRSSRDLWILGVAVVFAVISVASFRQNAADRDEPAPDTQEWISNADAGGGDLTSLTLRGGRHWNAVNAAFSLANGAVVASAHEEPGFALLAFDAAPVEIVATVTGVAPSSGIVFGFVASDNYWAVVAPQGSSHWTVTRVSNGTGTVVATAAPVDQGAVTLDIRRVDGRVEVLVDGVLIPVFIRDEITRGSAVGLLAGPGDVSQTQWTSFATTSATGGSASPG